MATRIWLEQLEELIDQGAQVVEVLTEDDYAPAHLPGAINLPLRQLDELDEDEMLDTMRLARRSILAIRKAMSPDGFNVGLNLGKVAGAGIADHLHLHVVPRWNGDTNFMPLLADTHVIPQALEATRAILAEAISELP